jgi:hypothetical protein
MGANEINESVIGAQVAGMIGFGSKHLVDVVSLSFRAAMPPLLRGRGLNDRKMEEGNSSAVGGVRLEVGSYHDVCQSS